ncbi:MAG: flagellar hook-basal body complex protein FliE [Terracidiphilus sp.]|jgi:flagellar hook-basal body complex protein FliE
MSTPVAGLGSIGTIGGLPKLPPVVPTPTEGGFSGVLNNVLQQVNQLNSGAEQQIGSLLTGGNTDMSSVMIAVEKADVAFQLMMQVRNKIVNAYQDIEKMQF